MSALGAKQKARLRDQYQALDPFELVKGLEVQLKKVMKEKSKAGKLQA